MELDVTAGATGFRGPLLPFFSQSDERDLLGRLIYLHCLPVLAKDTVNPQTPWIVPGGRGRCLRTLEVFFGGHRKRFSCTINRI